MSHSMPEDLAMSDAGATTDDHKHEDQEIHGAFIHGIEPGIGNQQSEGHLTPTLQDLNKFLSSCHTLHQATKYLTTAPSLQGNDIDPPEGKVYPHKIVQSPNFMEKQMEVWQLLWADGGSGLLRPIFPSMEQIHDTFFVTDNIDGEMTLCSFERLGVSSSVLTLVKKVLGDQVLRQAVGVGGDITYGSAQDTVDVGAPDEPTMEDDSSEDEQHRGFYVFSNTENRRPLSAVVVEFHMPEGFRLNRVMVEVLANGIVPDRDVIGQEEQGIPFDFSPTRVITAIITEAFHYMIKSGVRHGFIYTTDAIIFLEIQSDPSVVHYFISLPHRHVVSAQDKRTMPYSAVSQVSAFVIRAMQTRPTSVWNNKAANLDVWESNFEVREMLLDEIVVLPPLRRHKLSWPAAPYRDAERRADFDAGDSGNETASEQHDQGDIDIDPETSMTIEIGINVDLIEDYPQPLAVNQRQDQTQDQMLQADVHVQNEGQGDEQASHKKGKGKGKWKEGEEEEEEEEEEDQMLWIKNDRITSNDIRKREYCTQECLLGLIKCEPLDQACPNFHLHGDKHIDHIKFLKLVQCQISEAHGPSVDCVPLDVSGSISALFKVTLSSYGYTFVAKAVVEENSLHLCREGRIYSQLTDIQGSCIPVYLGIAKMALPYMYKGGALTHFMFLSWAGLPLEEFCDQREMNSFGGSVYRAYDELHKAGLIHDDVKLENMLYNSQQGRIMIVDFEHSDFRPRRLAGFDADGNDTAMQENEVDCGGHSSANECLQRVGKSECLHKEFEDSCMKELKYAVNIVDCLILGLKN
ncbi:hypothetical protein ACHAQJ_005545 [Trichoderma viride]